MVSDPYSERLAKVHQRFAQTLTHKIEDTYAALPSLSSGVLDTVDETYRRIHAICGLAATVGFPSTGAAASALEGLLLTPYRARRGLTGDEMARLREALSALSVAARLELASAGGAGRACKR